MSVATTVSTNKPARVKAELLIIPVSYRQPLPQELPVRIRRRLDQTLRQLKFKGQWGRAEFLPVGVGLAATFVALVGMGKSKQPLYYQKEGLRRGVARVVHDARRHLLRDVALVLPPQEPAALASAAYEAIELSNYRFTDHRRQLAQEQKTRSIRQLNFLTSAGQVPAVRRAIRQAKEVLSGVTFTRDLVNQPASHVSPRVLVDHAKAISTGSPRITARILNRQQALHEQFTAFLAVARGSSQEPYIIHLIYRPEQPKDNTKKIVLVGKGVTFDSGGLSLKPAQFMENMKIDMAGAATVLGVFSILPKLNLDIEIHGIIAACENMPSGDAYRPGDVVVAKNGKTIEVLNTDAEGRVTLADALSFAVEQKPTAVIDLATLTGASIIALGETYAGLWSNNEELRDQLLTAARESAEGLVAFPLPEEYRTLVESKIADVKNVASNHPVGAAITAALFLQEFVNSHTPWAHLDVAGPVYAERPVLPYYSFGGTGYGVRLLIEFLQNLDKQPDKDVKRAVV